MAAEAAAAAVAPPPMPQEMTFPGGHLRGTQVRVGDEVLYSLPVWEGFSSHEVYFTDVVTALEANASGDDFYFNTRRFGNRKMPSFVIDRVTRPAGDSGATLGNPLMSSTGGSLTSGTISPRTRYRQWLAPQ
jgi:hypothetical protein